MEQPTGIFVKNMLKYLHSDFRNVMGPATTAISYKFGLYIGASIAQQANLPSEELVTACLDEFSRERIGRFSILEFEQNNKFAKISVQSCSEASQKANNTPCSFTAGLLAGILKQVFGVVVISKEISCSSEGNETCIFEINQI